MLAGDLRQLAVEGDTMPLGQLLLLATALVLPALGGGDGYVGNDVNIGHVARFRIAA